MRSNLLNFELIGLKSIFQMTLKTTFQAVLFSCISSTFLVIKCIFFLTGEFMICCLGVLWWPMHSLASFVSCAQQTRTETASWQLCPGRYQL